MLMDTNINCGFFFHYTDVIMGAIASQITSLPFDYSTVYSDTDQRKHQSSASLAFVWGIHRWPVNSPHKWPVTRKMFPFDDVIMSCFCLNMTPFILQLHKFKVVISGIYFLAEYYTTTYHCKTNTCVQRSGNMINGFVMVQHKLSPGRGCIYDLCTGCFRSGCRFHAMTAPQTLPQYQCLGVNSMENSMV